MTARIVLSKNTVEERWYSLQVGKLSVEGGTPGVTYTFTLADDMDGIFSITHIVDYDREWDSLDCNTEKVNYENPNLNSFRLSVTAQGSDGSTINATFFDIEVINTNDRPTDILLDGGSVAVYSEAGTEVGSLSAVDEDAGPKTFSYAFYDDYWSSPIEHDLFKIENNKIVTKVPLSAEHVGTHRLYVKVTDTDANGTSSAYEYITVTVAGTGGTVPDPLPQTPQPPAPPEPPQPPAPTPLEGTKKNDKLFGTEGADAISGGKGKDKIFGNGGDDILNGGEGKDMLYGGAGKDTFVFDTRVKKGHFDHIKDFTVGEDTIQVSTSALSSFKVKMSKKDAFGAMKGGKDKGGKDKGGKDDFGGKKGSDKKSTFKLDKVIKKGKMDDKFFSLADKAKDSTDLFYYNSKNGFLYIDADGSGKGKGVAIAKLDKGLSITADDFLFI